MICKILDTVKLVFVVRFYKQYRAVYNITRYN
jgi:hypothetical protein